MGKKFSAAFGGQKFTPMGMGPGEGGSKNFFDQGGTLLIKVGQYFFTGVVILEKMAPQGGGKNFRPPSAAKNLPPPWALGPTS